MIIGPNTGDRTSTDETETNKKTVLTEEEAMTYPTGRGKCKNGFGKADGQNGFAGGAVH